MKGSKYEWRPTPIVLLPRQVLHAIGAAVILLALSSSLSVVSAPISPPKATIAVMDFKLALKKNDSGFQTTIRTSVITEKLKTALVETHKFEILERQDVDMLLDEMKFSKSSVSDKKGPKGGKMKGADYMITGEISLIDAGGQARPIPSTDRYNQILSGIIIADIRVIDTQRGVIMTAAKIEASSTRRSMSQNPNPPEVDGLFIEDLQRMLVSKMAAKVIETVFPIKVMQQEGNLVYLNRGEGGGLTVGDQVTAYELGKELIDPDTGERLGSSERPVAIMEVTEVLPKFTKARVIEGGGKVANGMIVRVNPPSEPAQ